MSDQVPQASVRPKAFIGIVTVVAIAVVVVTGFALFARQSEPAARAEARPPSGPTDTIVLAPEQRASVTTSAVTYRDLPVRTSVPGRIDFNANRMTPLFAQFSGRVVRLEAEPGMTVREGQVLGTVDSPEVVSLQADYQEALAAARVARTSLDQAIRTRERASRLADVEAIPLRELQEAQVAEAHATEDLQRAQAVVSAGRGKLQIAGFDDTDMQRLEAGGAASISRLVPLKAPVGGTIVERHVGLGQVVQAGGDPLLKIADLATVWVNADVYEDQLASIQPGREVVIQTPAYPTEKFAARVDRIAATVDPEKRTIAVRCVIANRDGRLKPGMFATVVLQSGTIAHALLVPSPAVVAAGNRRTVFVEQSAGTYQEKVIDTGDEVGGAIVVKAGLRDGDRVVTQGGVLLARQIAEGRSSR